MRSASQGSRTAQQTLRALARTVRAARQTVGDRDGGGARSHHELGNISLRADIAVYFGDDPQRLYQLAQWLPVLEELHRRRPVLLVFRNVHSLRAAVRQTSLPAVFVRRLADLLALYDSGDYRTVIYVNNGVTNFQSLSARTMLHVHVNHGESDKVCMVTNQAKAYDRVFVAGEAAVQRHRAALLDLDETRLVRIGRPQLDLTIPSVLPPSPRRTVLYAPTWEGENATNNYTSLDRYGAEITRQVLGLPDVRVVYRPHPRIPTSQDPAIVRAHAEVLELLGAAARREPGAGHVVSRSGSALALFQHCDALVSDVSSVGLDFLYLRTERPLFLTDRRTDLPALLSGAPIAAAADVVDDSTVGHLGALVRARWREDTLVEQRRRLRTYYFGDAPRGRSTERFLAAIEETLAERDRLLAAKGAPNDPGHPAGLSLAGVPVDSVRVRTPG